MDDFGNAWVILKVTEWVQTITSNRDPDESLGDLPGMRVRANCVVDAKSSMFRLSNKEDFSKLWVEVDLVEGPALLGNGKPVEKGIGIFDYGKAVDSIPSGFYRYMELSRSTTKRFGHRPAQAPSIGALSISTLGRSHL